MTVSNQTNRIAAVGNAAIGQEVPFSFGYTAKSDIKAYSRVTATGVETLLVETTNYTLTEPSDTGGTLTTVTAVAATSEIHIIRDTPKTQALDLEAGGSFSAEDVEDALDKNTKLIIENRDSLDRALRAPATDAVALDLELPNSVDRASKNLGFDANGNATVTDSSGTFATQTAAWNDIIVKSPWFDVRAYGATGDGTTNDTAFIQAAIDAMEAANGGRLYFPSGTYLTDALTVTMPSSRLGFVICGNGMSSCLKANSAIDIFTVDMQVSNFGGLIFEKLKFDLSDYDSSAIVSSDTGATGQRAMFRDLYILCTNATATKKFITLSSMDVVVEFNNVVIIGSTQSGIGISLDGIHPNNNTTIVFNGVNIIGVDKAINAATYPKSLITIINSRLDENNYGVYFDTVPLFALNIQNTRFEGNLEAGIFLKGTDAGNNRMRNIAIQNSYFSGIPTTKFGISAQRIRHFDILNTYFDGAAGAVPLTIVNTPINYLRLRNNDVGPTGMAATITGAGAASVLSVLDITVDQNGIGSSKAISFIGTLADEATPSINTSQLGTDVWLTGGTTGITDFDDGVTGQVIIIIAEHSVTITDGTNIFLSGSANWAMTATDTLTLICKADNKWYEISRSDSGA